MSTRVVGKSWEDHVLHRGKFRDHVGHGVRESQNVKELLYFGKAMKLGLWHVRNKSLYVYVITLFIWVQKVVNNIQLCSVKKFLLCFLDFSSIRMIVNSLCLFSKVGIPLAYVATRGDYLMQVCGINYFSFSFFLYGFTLRKIVGCVF